MITSHDVRQRFIHFFEKNGHQHIESSSLIPHNDSTLLFANAGMNQFKDYFTGKDAAKNKRAVTVQKCVRAGGKHNDLENVGMTARHHTFFEMLGNFSFGDYFKAEAISLAWKFLTQELKIPQEKLFVTVHYSDDEALNIWHRQEGVPLERIFKRGDKDNFWEMGDTGPCGPCSEIFFDHGPKYTTPNFTPGEGQSLLDDEQRYVEIWNLVFMQFEKTKEGTLKLPNPSIDTGAGLERLTAALQNKYWNYDSDLFSSIIHKLEELSQKKYQDPKAQTSMRVVADHIRSSTMLITDGVIPSNEGRGYVLRRIIRRAIRHMRELGLKEVSLYKLVPSVFESLGETYPSNAANAALAQKLLQLEEKKFLETLDLGMKFLGDSFSQVKNNVLSGELAFKLYDTFGFPLDLTEILAQEKGFTVDLTSFNKAMEKQKETSRASWKGGAGDLDKKEFFKIKEQFGPSTFLGYETLECQAKLLKKMVQGERSMLVFDHTPFYGESGGQAGDKGDISDAGHVLAHIDDTQKPVEDLFVHFSHDADALEEGKTYTLRVQGKKRELTKRNHSATHLLQAALIKTLGAHVKQAGSLVNDEKLRFDYTHSEKLKDHELQKVQELVNEQIQLAIPVDAKVMTKDDAIKVGALAFFGEKYGEKVRVLKMGAFSTEFCGGTHVSNTAEIGCFAIISESALASGVRRIEAVTSENALRRYEERSKTLSNVEAKLEVPMEKIIEKIESLGRDLKDKNKEIESLRDKIQGKESEGLFANPQILAGGLVYKAVSLSEGADLRKIADLFISKHPNGILFASLKQAESCSVILKVGKGAQKIDCGKALKKGLELVGGRGGGKPDMAQGSCPANQLETLTKSIFATIEEAL